MTQYARQGGLRQLLGNFASLLTGKAAAGVISLVYLFIAARMLGVAQYGVLNLVHGYITLVGGIVAFSGWHGMVHYGAEALHGDDPERFLRLARFMAKVELAFGLAAILIAMVLVPWVSQWLHWPREATHFAYVYSLAVLATVRATPNGILQLADRFDLIGVHQAIMPLCRVSGALIAWAAGWGLQGFLWIWLLSAIAEGGSMWILGLRELARMKRARGWTSGASSVPAHRQNPGLLWFITTTNADLTLRGIAPNAVPLVIGWLLGPAATGLFSLAQKASVIILQPSQMLGQASFPVMSQLLTKGRIDEFRHTVLRSSAFATGLALVAAVLIGLFGDQLLMLLGGKSFAGGAALMLLIALSRALVAAGPSFSAALTAMGMPSRSITVNLLFNIGLLPFLPLALKLGDMSGAGWYLIVQAALTTLTLLFLFLRALASFGREA